MPAKGGDVERSDGTRPASPGNVEGGFLEKITDLSLELLFTENLESLADEVSKIVVKNFPVRSMLVLMRKKYTDPFIPFKIVGYPDDRIEEIRKSVSYSSKEIKDTLDTAIQLGKFSRLFPAEKYAFVNDLDRIETLFPELIGEPRKSPDSWHPLDRGSFHFIDRAGEERGYIYITSTTDDKLLSRDSIDGLDILSSITSVAMELVDLRETAQALLEKQEKRTIQTAQIVTVTSAILTLTDPTRLINRVLELLDELFGFKSSCIAFYDEFERKYKWVGFNGYTDKQIAKAKLTPLSKEIADHEMSPEFRIGILAHLKPAEKTIEADLQDYFVFDSAEQARELMKVHRASPDSWHPLDDLIFSIQDRSGNPKGVIYVDRPSDGKLPNRETIEMTEIFVSLVAIAIENAGLYSDAKSARDEVHVLNRLMFHDLMNYSMAIRGYLDLAALQTDDAGIDRYIERAMKQIDTTAELIDKVRKLSAIRSADRKNMLRIDLGRTITNQATKTAGIFPTKKVKFTFDFSTEDAFVMANDLLPDLFHNIFMNAIKIDTHDTVNIEVALRGDKDRTDASRVLSWVVSVADHGPGIADDRKPSIFLGVQKFLPSEPARGMGLGLSIVRSLLDLYGGEVWVEDREPGHHEKGAVFLVRLPAA